MVLADFLLQPRLICFADKTSSQLNILPFDDRAACSAIHTRALASSLLIVQS